MSWREYITPKNILILIVSIYAITAIERALNKPEPQNDVINEHRQEKLQMQEDINYWKNKSERYEILILKNNAAIDTLNNDELDSTWAAIFG